MVAEDPSVELLVVVATVPAGVPADALAIVIPVVDESVGGEAKLYPPPVSVNPPPPNSPACCVACVWPGSVRACVWLPSAVPVKVEVEVAVWVWDTKVAFALPPVAATA